MKRTTVMLPEETLARLKQDARHRGISVAEVVRTAVERHLAEPEPTAKRHLAFFATGEGGPPDGGRNVDQYLAEGYLERERRRNADRDASS